MNNKDKMRLHAGDIEVIVAKYLNPRQNLIVPNVCWGLGLHEIDLLVLTPSKYAWEIEIKTSLTDLKADKNKRHGHYSNIIKRLYFAVPEELQEQALRYIPERAGLFVIIGTEYIRLVRAPKINIQARKFNENEIKKLYELAAMRLWSLKEIIYRLKRNPANLNQGD